MKERPIIFSGPMVRAIIEGRKTQTRRIIKPQPQKNVDDKYIWASKKTDFIFPEGHKNFSDFFKSFCPHGQPGDLLYVKEGWQAWKDFDHLSPTAIPQNTDILYLADRPNMPWDSRRRSPLHMPRWASRITLRITGVRVERLREISPMDAVAEGMCALPDNGIAQSMFQDLWQILHGPGSWEVNPWVWVIEFERVKP